MTKIFLKIILDNPSGLDNVESIEGNPPTNKTQNRKTKKVKTFIRKNLKTLINDLREIKANKSVPVLLGQGFTIAVKGQIQTINRQDGGFNFIGTWNRGASYWTREKAEKRLAQLQPHVQLDLEVIHYNDIRDRHEVFAKSAVSSYFKIRNHAF
jgi:hypothetical protein